MNKPSSSSPPASTLDCRNALRSVAHQLMAITVRTASFDRRLVALVFAGVDICFLDTAIQGYREQLNEAATLLMGMGRGCTTEQLARMALLLTEAEKGLDLAEMLFQGHITPPPGALN